MKKTLILFCVVIIAVGNIYGQSSPVFRLNPSLKEGDYLAKNVIIAVKPSYRNICSADKIENSKIQQVFNSIGARHLKKKHPAMLPPARKINAQGLKYADLSLTYEFDYAGTQNLESVINLLLSTGILEYAEPHYIPKTSFTPNDPQLASQYCLTKIQAANGWNISTGDTNIVIGLLDTGIDTAHPDLTNKIKKNYADPINGIDDDSDGFIDNFAGWDLGEHDNDPSFGTCPSCNHGVHVAGIAGAETNNAIGIAGVGFMTMLLPVKVTDSAGVITNGYEGITYAADHGAKIINCSWADFGGGAYGQSVVTYATINKDALVCAPAGNNALEEKQYPAAYNYVISVASTSSTDARSTFSTYDYSVDVCAPGTSILSTLPGNTYGQMSGTSMASPCVAGITAIIRSYYPSYTALQAGGRLKQTADNIYNAPASNAVYANKLGTGRVNLYRALSDTATPFMEMLFHSENDNNDNIFLAGDTLLITGDYINYFSATGSVTASLTPSGTNLTTLDNTATLGILGTNTGANNNADPFKFVINAGTPVNTVVTFTLNLSDGTINQDFLFKVTVNVSNISGHVTYSGGNIASGNAFLIVQGASSALFDTVATAPINAGNYVFNVPNAGQYYVRAEADTAVYHNTLVNTYFGNKYLWDSAAVINHSSADTADIVMLELPVLTGSASLSGVVYEGVGYGQKIIPGNPVPYTNAIPGVPVKVGRNPSGTIVASTTTDSSGTYHFSNLPVDNYRIYTDIPGYPMDSSYIVSITNANDSIINLDYIVDSNSVFIDITASVNNSEKDAGSFFYVYPNPTSGSVYIKLRPGNSTPETKNSFETIRLCDMSGRIIYTYRDLSAGQGGNSVYHLDLTALGISPGIYLLDIQNAGKKFRLSFVK